MTTVDAMALPPRKLPGLSRRRFLGAVGTAAAGGLACVGYAAAIEPFWLEHRETRIALPGWPAELTGLRIAHLTDMHFDDKLPASYAREVARRVREDIKPDLVVFTGDLTTHNLDYLDAGADWLASLGAPTFMCLGNHDYDPATSVRVNAPTMLADRLETMLPGRGVTLLRNTSAAIELKGRRLHIAGVEDFYTGRLDPARAVRDIPEGEPRLMLCHNPDAADDVDAAAAGGLVLAGHTHGGQVRLPGVGQVIFNTMNQTRTDGLYPLATSQLFVSRGVGYLLHARFLCRPEIAIHIIDAGPATTTKPATAPAPAAP